MPLFGQVIDATNPALGVTIFALGGLAGAVFYLPVRKMKGWAWETSWLVLMAFGLIVVPWVTALITSPNTVSVLRAAPGKEIGYCFACGAAWAIGGIAFGLTLRYLGIGLGFALILGLCSAAGTVIPPILRGELDILINTEAGLVSLVAVLVSLIGIGLVGAAGMSKTNELPEAEKKIAVAEFNFRKGLCMAILSGLVSAALNFGLQGGRMIESLSRTIEPVTSDTWKGMPVLVVVLLGGFVVTFGYCLYLNMKNRTLGDYARPAARLTVNTCLAALAGALWCSQLLCLKAAEPQMGKLSYIGWAVLMTSAIFFSTLVGIVLGEWKNTSSRTRRYLALGLLFLVASAVISGYAGYVKQ